MAEEKGNKEAAEILEAAGQRGASRKLDKQWWQNPCGQNLKALNGLNELVFGISN